MIVVSILCADASRRMSFETPDPATDMMMDFECCCGLKLEASPPDKLAFADSPNWSRAFCLGLCQATERLKIGPLTFSRCLEASASAKLAQSSPGENEKSRQWPCARTLAEPVGMFDCIIATLLVDKSVCTFFSGLRGKSYNLGTI